MYAIIEDSGHQYHVEEGKRLQVDYRESTAGDEIRFERVLLVRDDEGVKLGQPTVEGASVTAQVVGVVAGPKIVVQKLRRRKNSRRKTGHRQLYTEVTISKIELG